MSLSNILMCWLAVFGCSVTISTLDGPFGWCKQLRDALGQHSQAWVRKGINCPICVSFWVAPLVILFFVPEKLIQIYQLWFSSVGAVAAIAWLSPPAHEDTPPVA